MRFAALIALVACKGGAPATTGAAAPGRVAIVGVSPATDLSRFEPDLAPCAATVAQLRYVSLHVHAEGGVVTTDIPGDDLEGDRALQCVDEHVRAWKLTTPGDLVIQLGLVPAVDAPDPFLAPSYVDAMHAMCDAVPDDGKVRDHAEVAALVDKALRAHHDPGAIKLWSRVQTMNAGERGILVPYTLARVGVRSCPPLQSK